MKNYEIIIQAIKKKAQEESKVIIKKSVNIDVRSTRFEQKYSDEQLRQIHYSASEKHYTDKSKISEEREISLQQSKEIKSVCEKKEPLLHFLTKRMIYSYSNENKNTGENRGNNCSTTREIIKDSFYADSKIHENVSAISVTKNINVVGFYRAQTQAHSELYESNEYSFKHGEEKLVATMISTQTNNRIFVTGDCFTDDPEIMQFTKGNVVKNEHSFEGKQKNPDLVIEKKLSDGTYEYEFAEIKTVSLSKVLRKTFGFNPKDYDVFYSVGYATPQQEKEIAEIVTSNVSREKQRKINNMEIEKNRLVKKNELTEEEIERKEKLSFEIENEKNQIKNLIKYKEDPKLEHLNNVTNVSKVVYNMDVKFNNFEDLD